MNSLIEAGGLFFQFHLMIELLDWNRWIIV